MKNTFLITLFLLLMVAGNRIEASVIYVDSSKNAGLNNGTSWANALLSFQSALDASVSGDSIWVAKGTYMPSYDYGLGGGSRFCHFRMKNNVSIFGGFAGTETSVSQRTNYRAGEANETILSGDLNGDDVVTGAGKTLSFSNNGENCYHVFYHPGSLGLNNTAILDGFSITGGNANGANPHHLGGGFLNYSNTITLNNLSVYNNYATYVGGGFANFGSALIISNSFIRSNYSEHGGAMYSTESPTSYFSNVLISENKSNMGGGIANVNAPCSLTQVTVTNNYADWAGGGLYSAYNSFSLMNCIVWGNDAGTVGTQIGVYQGGSMSINHSCIDNEPNYLFNESGSTTTLNSISEDPLFANITYRDYRLSGTSPCADAGNDAHTTALYDVRGIGFERKLDKLTGGTGTVDMGAYEYKAGSDPLIPCINLVSGGTIGTDQSVCPGSAPARINAIVSPEGHSGILEFQWQLSETDSISGFTDIPGANDSAYQPAAVYDTTWFKRLARVDCMNEWSGAAESNVVKISTLPLPKDFISTSGLLAYYPFAGNARDESVHGNDGTIFGPVLTSGIDSKPDNAYSFDGINDYILVGDPVPASLQIQNEITLSAWIFATEYPESGNLHLIVGSQCDACGASGVSIFLDGRTNSDGQISPPGHIHFQIGNGSWHASNNNSQVPLNKWVHIVATRKANENARIYVDGVPQPLTSAGWDGSVKYSDAFFAIGRQRDTDRFFKGSIDEVKVYNRSLSDSEVLDLYNLLPSLHLVNDTLCENDSTEILLFNSQKGISYQLKKDGFNTGIPQIGNEATLVFSTGRLTSSTQFSFEATDTASSCSVSLSSLLSVTVNKLPVVADAFVMPASICVSGQASFSATASSGAISWYDAAWNGNKLSTLNPVIDTSTTYYAEAISPQGCISLNRTEVTATVYPEYFFAENYELCKGESYVWHGNTYTVAGTYFTAYTTANGCDSIFKLTLTLKPSFSFTESYEICKGESIIWQGHTYNNTGIYSADYITSKGCDSIYTLNLTVNSVDTSVVQNGFTLTSNATPATYKWLNCSADYAELAGETNQSYNAGFSGTYSVEITQNNCVDTSACYSINIVGIDESLSGINKIYPNPLSNDLIIEMSGNNEMVDVEILDALGLVIYKGNFINKTTISTGHFKPGIYFIRIENGKTLEIKKIIKD